MEKKEEVKHEELNQKMEWQKIINEEAYKAPNEGTKGAGWINKTQIELKIETKSTNQVLQGNDNTPQTIKLQKYAIAPFSGD